MAIPKCELCDKSEDPNSQSKVGFKLSNRSVYGALRRLLCNNCIAYLKRNKDIDFEKARLRRAGKEGRLAYSETLIGKCECCKRSDIEVKSRTFRRGKFRETVCEACNAHIHQHPEMNLEEIKNDRNVIRR